VLLIHCRQKFQRKIAYSHYIKDKIICIISVINKINNFTKAKSSESLWIYRYSDSLCSFTSRWGKKTATKVGAIKNSRLVPDYLQTCKSTFRILILWKHIYIFIYFCIFSSELRRMIKIGTHCVHVGSRKLDKK
jgi:hypothetical protein